jgi:hypothetical protein
MLTPMNISFGRFSYSFMDVLLAVGKSRVIPHMEFPSVVVNRVNDFPRQNQSCIRVRVLQDHESWNQVGLEDLCVCDESFQS